MSDNETIIDGQCISVNALGMVGTAKIVLRGHIHGCQSAYQKIPLMAPLYVAFALHRGLKSAKHRQHEVTPTLRVYFVQLEMNTMTDVTTSAFLWLS